MLWSISAVLEECFSLLVIIILYNLRILKSNKKQANMLQLG